MYSHGKTFESHLRKKHNLCLYGNGIEKASTRALLISPELTQQSRVGHEISTHQWPGLVPAIGIMGKST